MFAKLDKNFVTKLVTIVYNRDDILARREKAKDGSVNQTECQMRITKSQVEKPLRQGKHYGASNDGNAIALVRLPAWTAKESMMATQSAKLVMLGPRRWDVGGQGRLDEVALADEQAKTQAGQFQTIRRGGGAGVFPHPRVAILRG